MNKLSIINRKPLSYHVYVTPKLETSKSRVESITLILSAILSNEISLYVKTRRFDWNVSKVNSAEMHNLFQFQYLQLEKSIKQITDRISRLGGQSVNTMKEYLALSPLPDAPENYPASKEMIQNLLSDHESAIVHLRNDIGTIFEKYHDADTADFLIFIMETHETMARLLRRANLSQGYLPTYQYN